jgi:hypothetical protein
MQKGWRCNDRQYARIEEAHGAAMNREGYCSVLNKLVERIEALIPEHPEILELRNPFDLFKVPGFYCSDLEPSLMQASAALVEAKKRHQSWSEDR